MTPIAIQLTIGVILLFLGSEFLVRGGVNLLKSLRVPSLWIGLTAVAYGTASPELFVSAQAAMTGSPDLALGNIIGSNLCNLLLVLGVVALIQPLATDAYLVRRDMSALIASTAALTVFCFDGSLNRMEGMLLLGGLIGYTWYCFRTAASRPPIEDGGNPKPECSWCAAAYLLVALGLLVTGADILINASLGAAERLGVSEAAIGLTLVAFITSLPELATSAWAARRGGAGMSLSNLVGGCLFNILGIAGLCAVINPMPVAQAFTETALWAMLAASAVCLAALLSKKALSRVEGAVLVALYAGYIVYQFA